MKKIKKYIVVCLAALALVGCKDKMRELNSNPDTIGDSDVRYMFLNAMQNYDYNGRTFVNSLYKSTGVMMQYFVPFDGAKDNGFCNDDANDWKAPETLAQEYKTGLWSVGKQMNSLTRYVNTSIAEGERSKYQDVVAIAGVVEVAQFFNAFQNYGAAVYSQAFMATEGILKPEYDIFTVDVYLELDARVKEYVATLAAAANANTVELGEYDPIYGYITNPTGGAPEKQGDYEIQRKRWKMYGNTVRLNMAWIMEDVEGANLDDVLAETIASGLFESAEDGAYSHLNGPGQNNEVYNSDDTAEISVLWSVTDNFIQYLKAKEDPRLPLLARNNSLNDADSVMQWIQAYFPDSLEKHKVYKNGVWTEENWSPGQLDFENDPKLAYQGQNANPRGWDLEGPGLIWGDRSFTFTFNLDVDADANGKFAIPLATLGAMINGKSAPNPYFADAKQVSQTLNLASRPQGRYFVSMGGKAHDDNTTSGNGFDGSVDNRLNIYYTHPIYTYPEQCFLMALLALEGRNVGTKDAAAWYKEGVEEAMKELQTDAVRYQVQVVNNTNFSHTEEYKTTNAAIVGVNETEVYNLNATRISDYIRDNASGALSVEDIVGQVWIYNYNNSINMWNWWRKTGYPAFQPADDLSAIARTLTSPYFTKLTNRDGSQALQIPRRGELPQPSGTINNVNFNATQAKLVAIPDFGDPIRKTTGRIFWDKNGL